jgi:hypothetical protein
MEQQLESIVSQLSKCLSEQEALLGRLESLERESAQAPVLSSNLNNERVVQIKSENEHSATTQNNPKSSNLIEGRGKEEKGKQRASFTPSSYSKQNDPFVPESNEDEEPGSEPFPQREGGLSLYNSVLAANYEDLARHVHGIWLDPDCIW